MRRRVLLTIGIVVFGVSIWAALAIPRYYCGSGYVRVDSGPGRVCVVGRGNLLIPADAARFPLRSRLLLKWGSFLGGTALFAGFGAIAATVPAASAASSSSPQDA